MTTSETPVERINYVGWLIKQIEAFIPKEALVPTGDDQDFMSSYYISYEWNRKIDMYEWEVEISIPYASTCECSVESLEDALKGTLDTLKDPKHWEELEKKLGKRVDVAV